LARCARRFLLALSLVAALGCRSNVAIQTIARPDLEPRAPKSPNCELIVRPADYRFDPGCREIGDVYIGDTGFSVNCGLEQVMDIVRGEACRAGADAAQVVAHHEPSFFGSTCHQVRARFLVCEPEVAGE
jgi:hypothetical protein